MNRYSITEFDETGVYEREDNYLLHVTIRDKITKAESTPSAVVVTIKNPCGTDLVTNAPMTSLGTGAYSYDYAIPADALYGKYMVTVSTATYQAVKTFAFHLFPWNANEEIRQLSGIGENKSISDSALNNIIWESFNEVRQGIYTHHVDEFVKYNCSLENCGCTTIGCFSFDGTNTTFWTRENYIADYDDNGVVQGYGEASCVTDVTMRWKDCSDVCHVGHVEILDDVCGKIKLTSDGVTAIPQANAWVKVSYWTRYSGWTRSLMHEAINYLAAHKVLLRFGELERATAADLVNAQNVKYVNPKRMYKEYRRILRKIRRPVVGGV